MYWAGAASAVTEGSVLEESSLGWGSSGWESGGVCLLSGAAQGGGGGSPAARPALQRHDPGVCVVWNRQGEGVGRVGAGGEHAFTRAHSAVRGRVSIVSGAVRTHHSSGVCRLLTRRLALCHLGASGPRGRPSQMLGNGGVRYL